MLSQEQLTAALKAFGEAVPAGTKLHSLKVTPSAGYTDTETKPVFVFVLADSDKDVQWLSQVIDRGTKTFESEQGLTASLLRESPAKVFQLNPTDPANFGAVNPGIEALKKLEGRQVAMLDQQELKVLRMFMDQGRKQGVSVEFDTDTDEQAWPEMNSARALEILAVANSYVRLRFTY